jgi:hypothetical protein
MTTYVVTKDANGKNLEFRVYNDLTEPEVSTLLSAEGIANFVFVTDRDYATVSGTPLRVIETNATLRNQAINLLSNDIGANPKFVRAVLLVLLDEINVLRTALSLAQRTVAQAKTAVQNKINSGSAD